MLWQRLLFGALLIAILAGLLYGDHLLSKAVTAGRLARCDGLIVAVVVALLIILGSLELGHLMRAAGHRPAVRWAALSAVCISIVPFLNHNEILLGGVPEILLANDLTMVLLPLALFGAAVAVGSRKRTEGAIAAVAGTMFIVLYLGLLAQFIVRIRAFAPESALWPLIYFVATVKISDIGAYFIGLAFGRHRLIPWLSPRKTIEGLLGGIAASVAFSCLAEHWMGYFASRPVFGLAPKNPWALPIGFGVAMAILGQAGDLLESLLKRDAEAKDSARVIPAFGGVLDILDSLLLAAPVACLLLLE